MKLNRFLLGLFFALFSIPILVGQEPINPPAEQLGKGFKLPPKEVLEARHADAEKKYGKKLQSLPRVSAPTWDCRTLGIVPPILAQGNCGSCYIFSAAGPATSAFIQAGKGKADGSFRLCEQYGLDCQRQLGGCGGGWPAEVLEHMKTKGWPLESEYGPYTARSGACKTVQTLLKIDDYGYCEPGNTGAVSVQAMKNAIVKYGPISVALDSSGLTSGSDDRVDTCSGRNVDHAVMIVGWDDNRGTNGAWLMRNSWGPNWANGGYRWLSFKSYIVEALWADVAGDPVPPTPDPIPPGPTPQPDSIVVTGGDVVVVTEVSSLPFTLTVASNGLGYVWDVPEGVKYKRKNNAIEITFAPKGDLSVSVEYSVVDFKAGAIIPKFAEKKLRVNEIVAPKKPTTKLDVWTPAAACCGRLPDFQFGGIKLVVSP